MLAAGIDAAPRTIAATAVPSATAIKLDGEFTESVWERVPAVSDFRQREPKDDAAPTFATEVKVAYDASHVYVAVFAHDPDGQARSTHLSDGAGREQWEPRVHVADDRDHDLVSRDPDGVQPGP